MSISLVCVCVCHRGNPASWWTGDFWSKSVSLLNTSIPVDFGVVVVSMICCINIFSSIMGEFAGGGSVTLAVGISDRWQVTGDR